MVILVQTPSDMLVSMPKQCKTSRHNQAVLLLAWDCEQGCGVLTDKTIYIVAHITVSSEGKPADGWLVSSLWKLKLFFGIG